MMKRGFLLFSFVLLMASTALGAGPKTYQVTGPVIAINGGVITVQKGAEKWDLAFDQGTKTTGDLKVGAKVTIQYQMKATTITVKPAALGAKGH